MKTTSVSTGSGRFVIPLLQPGTYTVSVIATGFETLTQEHVVVAALAEVPLNPRLSIGAASQTVIVTDETLALQTEDVKLGSNISNETYDSRRLFRRCRTFPQLRPPIRHCLCHTPMDEA